MNESHCRVGGTEIRHRAGGTLFWGNRKDGGFGEFGEGCFMIMR